MAENDGVSKYLGPLNIQLEFIGLDNGTKKVWIYDPEPGNMNQHNTLAIVADSSDEAMKLFPQLMVRAAKALFEVDRQNSMTATTTE